MHKLVVTVHVYLYFIYIIVGAINLFTVMTMWVRGGCHELDCLRKQNCYCSIVKVTLFCVSMQIMQRRECAQACCHSACVFVYYIYHCGCYQFINPVV